ncbi:MAG: hypothetical protein H7Y17_15495, partial [Chlorobia bacterium]|nr:hypothetical protein [Fimbriimonadaceae bacterium]
HAMGSGNQAFIPVMQGNWPEALRRLEACYETRTMSSRKIPMDTLLPCLAMVRMMLGRKEEVLAMLRQGFFDANASESEQFQMTTFEFAACSLSCTEHKAFARSVVDWVEDWRSRTNLPRSAAEMDLLERVFTDIGPGSPLKFSEPPPNVGRELLRYLRNSLQPG